MEQIEKHYIATKNKITTLLQYLKVHRQKLNELADSLLDNNDTYEFTTADIILSKPRGHKSSKPKKS